ncbi:MAG: hypothetical protein HQM03_20825 [Magnetococcales bacterium]|nr:hypothetical protein [Magnetococcales bacterium]
MTDSHDEVMHEVLRGLGRVEATSSDNNLKLTYQQERLDEMCQRLKAVETKVALNAAIVSVMVSFIVANFKTIIDSF